MHSSASRAANGMSSAKRACPPGKIRPKPALFVGKRNLRATGRLPSRFKMRKSEGARPGEALHMPHGVITSCPPHPSKRTCASLPRYVRSVLLADISAASLDHLVGAGEQLRWHREAERLGC